MHAWQWRATCQTKTKKGKHYCSTCFDPALIISQKPNQNITVDVDNSDDDLPSPSELSWAASWSGMISEEDNGKDNSDSNKSDAEEGAESDDIAFIGMLTSQVLS